jgi:hypothetical protein
MIKLDRKIPQYVTFGPQDRFRNAAYGRNQTPGKPGR